MTEDTFKAQWLGGPNDGDWVELPIEHGLKYLLIADKNVLTKFAVPIVENSDKFILDYYSKEEVE